MKIITAYPIINITKRASKRCEGYSAMDASSSMGQIKAFQDWLDVKYPNWYMGKTLNKASGYGTFGPITKAAYGMYGSEFEKGVAGILGGFNNPFLPKAAKPNQVTSGNAIKNPATDVTTSVPSIPVLKSLNNPEQAPDAKGWSSFPPSKKAIIISVSGLIIGLIIFAIIKKK